MLSLDRDCHVKLSRQGAQLILMFKGQAHSLNLLHGEFAQVSDGAVLDLAVLAKALTQKVTGVGLLAHTNGRCVDVHSDYKYSQ